MITDGVGNGSASRTRFCSVVSDVVERPLPQYGTWRVDLTLAACRKEIKVDLTMGCGMKLNCNNMENLFNAN